MPTRKDFCKNIITFLIPIFLIAVAFIDTFFYPGQMVTSGWRDILTVNLPELIYANWQFPLYNGLWITGFPALADALSNIYYPFVYVLIQTVDNIVLSTNIIVFTHLLVGFITSYLFFGLLTKNRGLKIVFSLTYIFSFALLSRIDAGHEFILVALAWVPLLYYATTKILYYGDNTVKNIILFAVSASLIFLSGSLYYIVYPFIFIAIYSLYLLITREISIKTIATLGIATGIFVLVTAVKSIPILVLSDQITRIDTVEEIAYSLESGGSLESNIASLVFGTKINLGYEYFSLDLGAHESSILIGAISLFLIIIALIYGKKAISVPSFLALSFSFIWAAAGKTIFSFIHLLPFLDSLRCPGRIWGGILPILIILSVYGLLIVINKIKNNEDFSLSNIEKKRVIIGIAILLFIKICELPYQEVPSVQSVVSIILVVGFIVLVYLNKLTQKTLTVTFAVGLIINLLVVLQDFTINTLDFIKTLIIGVVIVGILVAETRKYLPDIWTKSIPVLLSISLILCCMGGISTIHPSIPGYEDKAVVDVVDELSNLPSNNTQKWIAITGWPHRDMAYTYHIMKSDMHAINAYYAYYLNTMLPIYYTIGDKTYSTADYIIDTDYPYTGELYDENYVSIINGVPIVKPEYTLPNVFILREDEVIGTSIQSYSNDVVIAMGDYREGDLVILKSAYYEGWEVNGHAALPIGNMIGFELSGNTNQVTFEFSPWYFKFGVIFSILGITSVFIIFLFRHKINKQLGR